MPEPRDLADSRGWIETILRYLLELWRDETIFNRERTGCQESREFPVLFPSKSGWEHRGVISRDPIERLRLACVLRSAVR